MGHAGGLQRRFIGGPGGVDALVVVGIVDQQLGLDAGDLVGRRRHAVKGHGRDHLGQARGEVVGHAAAEAKAHHADAASGAAGLGPRPQPGDRGNEIFGGLALVELPEQAARLVLIAGIATEREKGIWREGEKAIEREAARDVLNVRVQAAVLVHHQHRRQSACGPGGARQVAAATAVTAACVEVKELGAQPSVVGLDELRGGERRAQRRQQTGRCGAGRREARGAVQEAAPVDGAVDILIEQAQHLGIEICSGLAWRMGIGHRWDSWLDAHSETVDSQPSPAAQP